MIASLLGLAVLFLVVMWQVQVGGPLVTLDGVVNASFGAVRSRSTLAAGAWISQVGTGAAGAILCLAASGLLWSDGRLRYVGPLWVTFIGAQATTWSLKFITARKRPDFLEGITAASPSFPSAHATVSMAVFGALALVVANTAGPAAGDGRMAVYAVAGLLILSICVSRMLLSLHYFSDVLAGATVGLFWVLVGWWLATR